jgi:hypothetical protein
MGGYWGLTPDSKIEELCPLSQLHHFMSGRIRVIHFGLAKEGVRGNA